MSDCYESYEHAQLRMIDELTEWLNAFDSIDDLTQNLLDSPAPEKADLVEYAGSIDIPIYISERKQIIKAALKSSNLWVRYGGIAGASYLDDITMLPNIQDMLKSETNKQLINYAEQVLKYWHMEQPINTDSC